MVVIWNTVGTKCNYRQRCFRMAWWKWMNIDRMRPWRGSNIHFWCLLCKNGRGLISYSCRSFAHFSFRECGIWMHRGGRPKIRKSAWFKGNNSIAETGGQDKMCGLIPCCSVYSMKQCETIDLEVINTHKWAELAFEYRQRHKNIRKRCSWGFALRPRRHNISEIVLDFVGLLTVA